MGANDPRDAANLNLRGMAVRTSMHCYILNIEAGLLVSEKIF